MHGRHFGPPAPQRNCPEKIISQRGMWDQGGQPWPQWPLSQQQWMQSFQHQHDPGQVDWAALAQAWIAQKESTGADPKIEPNGQDMPGLEPPTQGNHGSFQGEPAFGRMWQPEWGMHSRPPSRPPPPPPPPPEQTWIPPGSAPMDVVNPSEDSNSQDSGEFNSEAHRGVFSQNSHGYGAQPDSYDMAPMAINQFDYQHGLHGADSSFAPPPSGFHSPYWQGPPQNRREARPPGFRERTRSPIRLPIKQEATAPLDALKRRTLPAWIREGLEKRDREMQKKLEQERMEKERAEISDDYKEHKVDDGEGPHMPRKSKFDSDDEDNIYEEKSSVEKEFYVRSPSPTAEESEPEMTDEEKEFQLMIITKTLLTEILLEVTNEEILHVAKEVHRKATRGGLGDYGSEESADEDDHSARGSESSDTDEEELRHRIREKLDAFHRKEREIQLHQEKLAHEAQLARDEMLRERLSRERGEYEEIHSENSHKEEIKEREVEPLVERRRSRGELESSEGRNSGRGKERSSRGGSNSPANGHSSSSHSSSSHSSSRSSSSSSTSSSRSSTRSSSPRRKRRRSRSHSSHRRRSEKIRDRRRSSTEQRTGNRKKDRSDSRERRSRRSRSRSRDRDRGRARARDSRSRSRDRGKDKERKRSRERRESSHSSKHKQKASSKDRERKRDRCRSHEKDRKRKDMDRERDSERRRDKARTKEKSNSLVKEENGKSKKQKEEDSHTDSQSDRQSRHDGKSSKKGSAKTCKKHSDSDSSRSPSPEVSKEKKYKKSKRSRSRSTEKSHKSGKKASRKHKSKSRSRSTSPSHRSRR
ncbi:arginine/serine-rich protein PNISR isoform X2 [Nerophis ophidion]|uniref:arginine/serine-rich protein PNISR isoform X2 n=1 Tax=Nerophis ophidion TaxID=159077 RepID=UPI002AE0AFC4|nr:arginine/serine-rich protein PNISR isoform X2 [Nerophis ophidion]